MTLIFLLHALKGKIYRQYTSTIGLKSASLRISSSSSAINRILYGGANFVPIAVPLFCLKIFLLNLKILFFSTTSARSQSVSVEIYFSFQLSNLFLRADRPSSCGILGYNPKTSPVHKMISLGDFGKERSLFKKSFCP